MKKILKVLLSRTFAFILLIFLQALLFFTLIFWLANFGSFVYTVVTLITVLVLVAVMEQDDLNPAYKLMWLMVIFIMPIFGTFFYLLWGHNSVPRRTRNMLKQVEERTNNAMQQNEAVFAALEQEDKHLAQSARYLINHAIAPLYPASENNQYYPIGEDFFPHYLNALRGAKKYIFMEYFIWENGNMLNSILDILAAKAAEGVDVRIIYDGVGSLLTMPADFVRNIRSRGIKCLPFSPVKFTFHITNYAMLNHRDHRKITIIDGDTGFSGGLNIADEYINIKERFGQWKDTAFMIRGEAVYSLTTTFLQAWDYVSGTVSNFESYRTTPAVQNTSSPTLQSGFVQPYCDSPLDNENVSENAYLNVLRSATSYVYISTPYLILDHEMITSLTLAAKSGVDVRILTPGIPDKPAVFLITQSYYPILLKNGVRIYEYTPGFNHAKMYVSDDRIAIIGSANMDYRSLYLHFENCVSFYGGRIVSDAKSDMLQSFASAREITLEHTKAAPLPRRLIQIVARFFAPML